MPPGRRLLYRLALRLGYPNPYKMLAEMPWSVWKEWQAFELLEPHDPMRLDLQLATQSAIMMNAWMRTKQNPRVWRAEDFLPTAKWANAEAEPETEEDKAERLLEYAKDLNAIFGGEFVDARTQARETDDDI